MKLKRIKSHQEHKKMHFESYYTISVEEQYISKIIQFLGRKCPIEKFLKRVKKVDGKSFILICKCGNGFYDSTICNGECCGVSDDHIVHSCRFESSFDELNGNECMLKNGRLNNESEEVVKINCVERIDDDVIKNNRVSRDELIFENEHVLMNNQKIENNQICKNNQICENNLNIENKRICENNRIIENNQILESKQIIENKQICENNQVIEDDLNHILNDIKIFCNGKIGEIRIFDVPAFIPITNEQFESALDQWPCYFFPKPEITPTFNNSIIEQLKKSVENDIFSEASVINNHEPEEIFQPNNNIIELQNKLTENENFIFTDIVYNSKQNQTSNKPVTEKITNDQNCSSNESNIISKAFHTFEYANNEHINKATKNRYCSGTVIFHNPKTNYKLELKDNHKIFHAIFKGIELISKQTDDYLCTGLDLYIYNEPCFACAVALVHGRIGNVFFYKESSGVYVNQRINSKKELNHRYNVYQILE